MRGRILAAVVALGLMAGAAIADTVTKTDGTVIEGDVTAETDDSVTIKCKLGVLTIPRADVAKVERAAVYDAESDLDAVKVYAAKELAEIAQKCDAAKQTAKAKAARALAEQVRAWTLEPKPAAGEKKPAGAKTPDKDAFRAVWNKWNLTTRDVTLTDVQRQKALDAFRREQEGKRFVIAMRVTDVRRDDDYATGAPRAQVTGEIWPTTLTTLYFSDAGDVARLEKVAKGSTINFDVILTCSPTTAEPLFQEPRLKDR